MTQADRQSAARLSAVVWRGGAPSAGERELPQEIAVALVHDATTTAVMMATPADLEDFAVGFSLTEGVICEPSEIATLEVVAGELGVEVRMWLAGDRSAALSERRRRLAGPTGCGLCGLDSLAEAVRPPPPVSQGFSIRPDAIHAALDALTQAQRLGAATRAVHAAGWWSQDAGLVALREDVGRHNALDKLVGALAHAGGPRPDGLLVLTSRVSVEMVQKAAAMDAQVLAAISAPTTLAVRTAEAAGLTLVAVARRDSFEVFTRAERILA
jgi:FdhD protein